MTCTTALDLLSRARLLISARERWACGIYELSQTRFCMLTALGAVVSSLQEPGHVEALRFLCLACGLPRCDRVAVIYWNDTHTHQEVLEAYDRAIAIAEAAIQEPDQDPPDRWDPVGPSRFPSRGPRSEP